MYHPREIEQEILQQLPDIVRPASREAERFQKMIAQIRPVTERYAAAGAIEIEVFRTNTRDDPQCLIFFRSREDREGGTFSQSNAERLSVTLSSAFEESAMKFVGFHLNPRPYALINGVYIAQPDIEPPVERGLIGRLAALFNRRKIEEATAAPPTEMRSKVYIFPHDLGYHR